MECKKKSRPELDQNLSLNFSCWQKLLTLLTFFATTSLPLSSLEPPEAYEVMPIVIECDASEHTLAATLYQGRQPVTFHLCTFRKLKPAIVRYKKKRRKRSYYLYSKQFILFTDQTAVSFILNHSRSAK